MANERREYHWTVDKRIPEALTFQDTMCYQEVYDGDSKDEELSKSLNEFLVFWLNNIIEQGHKID